MCERGVVLGWPLFIGKAWQRYNACRGGHKLSILLIFTSAKK